MKRSVPIPMPAPAAPSASDTNNQDESPSTKKAKTTASPNLTEKIAKLNEEAEDLGKQVDEFVRDTQRTYRSLDEMLTEKLLHLDDIHHGGHEEVRQARRRCYELINRSIAKLEGSIKELYDKAK